jgi:predicted TIM-barrel fold metal-dependent hydrolase
MRDLPKAIGQLEYWTKQDRQFAGLQIPRACPDGRMLDNPDLHPLYAAAQALDMPLWVHGGANRPPFTPWQDAPNGLYHSIGGQYALAALIGGGVFDLFPRLRIGLFESFGGWMPYVIEKLDDGYKPGARRTPNLKRTASEILSDGNLFCSVEADEKHIVYAVEVLGEHPWLFSTDYPHHGSAWPNAVPLIANKAMLEGTKIKLLRDNALRFLPRLAPSVAACAPTNSQTIFS